MKKVIFAIALVAGFAACNNATTTETSVDSVKVADSIKAAAAADSASKASAAMDTAKKAMDTAKAAMDTAKAKK